MLSRKEILTAVKGKKPKQISKWIESLEDEEAIHVMKELSAIAKETPQYKDDPEFRRQIEESEKETSRFEEICAEEKVTKLKHEAALERAFYDMENANDKLRSSILDEIAKNPPNVEDLKEFARGMIKIEKENDGYDPEKWKGFV